MTYTLPLSCPILVPRLRTKPVPSKGCWCPNPLHPYESAPPCSRGKYCPPRCTDCKDLCTNEEGEYISCPVCKYDPKGIPTACPPQPPCGNGYGQKPCPSPPPACGGYRQKPCPKPPPPCGYGYGQKPCPKSESRGPVIEGWCVESGVGREVGRACICICGFE